MSEWHSPELPAKRGLNSPEQCSSRTRSKKLPSFIDFASPTSSSPTDSSSLLPLAQRMKRRLQYKKSTPTSPQVIQSSPGQDYLKMLALETTERMGQVKTLRQQNHTEIQAHEEEQQRIDGQLMLLEQLRQGMEGACISHTMHDWILDDFWSFSQNDIQSDALKPCTESIDKESLEIYRDFLQFQQRNETWSQKEVVDNICNILTRARQSHMPQMYLSLISTNVSFLNPRPIAPLQTLVLQLNEFITSLISPHTQTSSTSFPDRLTPHQIECLKIATCVLKELKGPSLLAPIFTYFAEILEQCPRYWLYFQYSIHILPSRQFSKLAPSFVSIPQTFDTIPLVFDWPAEIPSHFTKLAHWIHALHDHATILHPYTLALRFSVSFAILRHFVSLDMKQTHCHLPTHLAPSNPIASRIVSKILSLDGVTEWAMLCVSIATNAFRVQRLWFRAFQGQESPHIQALVKVYLLSLRAFLNSWCAIHSASWHANEALLSHAVTETMQTYHTTLRALHQTENCGIEIMNWQFQFQAPLSYFEAWLKLDDDV